jgi:hypothetical protein
VKIKGPLFFLSLISFIVFFSCTKINEATELGDQLIPAVDNVNTFDTTLDVQAAFFPMEDSSRHLISEAMALGQINDPAFGTTKADMYFNLSSTVYGTSPFKDTLVAIDSVVLQLGYRGAYGDSSVASSINVDVAEINTGNGFVDTVLYRFDNQGFTTGSSIGSKTFSIPQFKDSFRISPSGKKNDSAKLVNLLRIKLNNSLGQKLAAFDTTSTGGFRNDSLFRTKFRGLAVKTVSASVPGTLAYFNIGDVNSSALLVYYRNKNGSARDTTVAVFVHNRYSQANSIQRNAGGEYQAKIGQSNSQKLYIQSSPSGSYIGMSIPGLSNFPNKVIHRAELIAYKVPADNPSFENVLTPPNQLLLDHKGANNSKDSAYIFDSDIQPGFDGSLNFAGFGGTLRADQSYRFNITRYVQGIVTRKERNDSLRLYAPLRATMYSTSVRQLISVPNLDLIAKGRVVIAGPTFPDQTRRLRLRIIYSNL